LRAWLCVSACLPHYGAGTARTQVRNHNAIRKPARDREGERVASC